MEVRKLQRIGDSYGVTLPRRDLEAIVDGDLEDIEDEFVRVSPQADGFAIEKL